MVRKSPLRATVRKPRRPQEIWAFRPYRTPPLGRTQKEQAGALVCEKKKEPAKPKAPVKPVVLASAGPEGHKSDCATMTSGQLQAAYKSEYQSWKNSKSRCKKKGWPWASGWESFKDF